MSTTLAPLFSAHVSRATGSCISKKNYNIIETLTAAARSTCPGAVAGFEAFPGAPPPGVGLGAEGIAGLLPTLGTTLGFAPTGGGLGLAATGGGGFDPIELDGREPAGELSLEGAFFQGVAEPLAAAIPGNTETGFADAFAVTGATGVDLTGGAFLGGGGGTGAGAA